MSLFLIYFEIGKPVPPSSLPAMLQQSPVALMFKGRSGGPREAMVLTDGHSSETFVAFKRGYAQEGEALRKGLFAFVQQRIEAGAHPHLVFCWLRGKVESISVDIEHVVRVPLKKLDDKFRAIEGFPIIDSSEVMEVTADHAGEEELFQPIRPSHVLVEISSENAATEPDIARWTGNVDVLVGDLLFSLGPSRGSLTLVPSLQTLAMAIVRLRQGARTVATRLTGDTASLRFIRRTSDGVDATVVAYRGVESMPVPVAEFDMACGNAVRHFLGTLRREQRAGVLALIGSTWPKAGTGDVG